MCSKYQTLIEKWQIQSLRNHSTSDVVLKLWLEKVFTFDTHTNYVYCLRKGLVANNGEGGGGYVKFYPYEKGGGGSFSHAKGAGGNKSFEVFFYAVALSFSHIEGGGRKVPTL